MDKNRNQEQSNQKRGDQPNQQENLNENRQRSNAPADNNPSGRSQAQEQAQGSQQSQGQQSQSGSQQSGEWKRPVTNQDEQSQTTNAEKSGDTALGEEESEGDERLKPYKNIGDDSEEIKRETPTME